MKDEMKRMMVGNFPHWKPKEVINVLQAYYSLEKQLMDEKYKKDIKYLATKDANDYLMEVELHSRTKELMEYKTSQDIRLLKAQKKVFSNDGVIHR